MIGFHTDSGTCYVCGSQPYRRGMGCGPGVYVPKNRVESEVLDGLREVLGICTDQKSFTRRVNDELRAKWEAPTGVRADSGQRIKKFPQPPVCPSGILKPVFNRPPNVPDL